MANESKILPIEYFDPKKKQPPYILAYYILEAF